jgi:hypothetical protein
MLFFTLSVGADMSAPKTFLSASFWAWFGDEAVGWKRNGSAGRVEGRVSVAASSSTRDWGMRGSSSGTVRRCKRTRGSGRKLRNARKGVRAMAISGLWLGSTSSAE